jgi:N-acetylmuramoyl-L-alanine amidase
MYSYYKSRPPQAARRTAEKSQNHTTFSIIIIVLIIMGVLMGFKLFGPAEAPKKIEIAAPQSSLPQLAPTVSIGDKIMPTRDPYRPLVGVVAGHKGNDAGAVCPDGLTEAEVNYRAAVEVVDLLERRGVQGILLDEFDERLTGLMADALVSIHADSCMFPGLTGFKVARVTDSAIPEAEDRLVACLNEEYGDYTGLAQNPATITDNMTNYHAFREIDRQTPGAIIEIGFLLDDRDILEHKPKIVARGIAAGVLCFLGK